MRALSVDHNTITDTGNGYTIFGETYQIPYYLGDTAVTNNIFGKNVSGFYRLNEHPTLASQMCRSTNCPISQWNKNLLIGAPIGTYSASPGAVANLCPTTAACATPNYAGVFRDFHSGKLDI